MNYKRNNKRFSVKGRGEYMSKADFFEKYYFNIENCRQFFFDIKWPNGYFCEKCGHTYYYFMKTKNCYRCSHCGHDERLLSHTIFQDNKLPYNVLLYGLFLVFTDKRQLSSLELAEELKVNYKTACLLHNKCRILMKNSNLDHTLDSSFYESDVAYTGTPAKQGKRGGTQRGMRNGVFDIFGLLRILVPLICIVLLVILLRSCLADRPEQETTTPVQTTESTAPETTAPETTAPTTEAQPQRYVVTGNNVNVRYADNQNRIYEQLSSGTEIGEVETIEGSDYVRFERDGLQLVIHKDYIAPIEN